MQALSERDSNTRAANLSAMMASMATLNATASVPECGSGKSDGTMPCCMAMQKIKSGSRIELDGLDKRGKSLLQYASFMGHEDCLTELLGAGANPNLKNAKGMTALHFAAASVFPEKAVKNCVAELSNNGADATIQNAAGKTPLDCVKDPERRKQLQGVLGIAVYEYEGRKTRHERYLDEEPNTSDEDDEEEELDDDDSEWDEWEWEWDEVWHYTDGSTTEEEEEEDEEPAPSPYTHSNRPRICSEVRVEVSTPGPFHPPNKDGKKYGI